MPNDNELGFTDEERATLASLWRQSADAIVKKDDVTVDRLMDAIQTAVDKALRRAFDTLGGPHASA
jgi:DNA/RNA-binding domain of Phe-tRNA-synthetase-like protein